MSEDIREFAVDFTSWLAGEGSTFRALPDYLAAFCERLNGHGFAIRRCNLATQTIHPLMSTMRHVWSDRPLPPVPIPPAVVVRRRRYRVGEGEIDEVYFNAFNERNRQYRASPFFRLRTCKELYEPIRPAGEPQPFPVFDDLARAGCTAYYGLHLDAFEDVRQMIGLATTRPGGLSEGRIDALRTALRLFTLHLNTLLEAEIKETLARTYVGMDPGRRVCSGMISLGEVVALDAAIWFSDLRGFTAISDDLEPGALIRELNRYFDEVVAPIYGAGGEVLKYVGDAILAIFPASAYPDAGAACRAALDAVGKVGARLEALNRARQGPPLVHGVGLHFGQAQYGNIGSRERLDFTLIGREVNLASRIEGLTKALDEPLLCSGAFVEVSGMPARPCGSFDLKGIAQPVEVFAPAR